MVSYGMLRRVALVRTTRRNIPEDTILQNGDKFYCAGFEVLAKVIMNEECRLLNCYTVWLL
jgi:hypothetical protein